MGLKPRSAKQHPQSPTSDVREDAAKRFLDGWTRDDVDEACGWLEEVFSTCGIDECPPTVEDDLLKRLLPWVCLRDEVILAEGRQGAFDASQDAIRPGCWLLATWGMDGDNYGCAKCAHLDAEPSHLEALSFAGPMLTDKPWTASPTLPGPLREEGHHFQILPLIQDAITRWEALKQLGNLVVTKIPGMSLELWRERVIEPLIVIDFWEQADVESVLVSALGNDVWEMLRRNLPDEDE